MNNVAILPQLAMRFLQRQNVKRNVVVTKPKESSNTAIAIENDNINDNINHDK